jgi:hypothetical protein
MFFTGVLSGIVATVILAIVAALAVSAFAVLRHLFSKD